VTLAAWIWRRECTIGDVASPARDVGSGILVMGHFEVLFIATSTPASQHRACWGPRLSR
jgi:hypothetical protein